MRQPGARRRKTLPDGWGGGQGVLPPRRRLRSEVFREQQRGSTRAGWPAGTTARGYGAEHQRLRAKWAPLVAAGQVNCWRCGQHIPPGAPWDLGHDDDDRTIWHGPEHRACNRGANARRVNRARGRRRGEARHDRPPLAGPVKMIILFTATVARPRGQAFAGSSQSRV